MPQTVLEVLDETCRAHAEKPALRHKSGTEWLTTSWREYRDLVHRAARGFLRLGLEPGQGVVIIGYNRPQWFVADLAAIAAGGVPAGIYTTSTAEQVQYIADHCEAAIAVVENRDYLATIEAIRDRLPHLKAVVLMTGDGAGSGATGWEELLALGDEVPEADLERRMAAQRASDLCTLIYTSGTTGPPKAVALSHRNLVWTARALADAYGIAEGDVVISYLPLSHIAEQVVSLHTPLTVGATSAFAESLERLGENLREVRPTFFFAVPRVWEKIQARMQAAGAANPPLKRKIAAWARGVGLAGGYAEQQGRPRPLLYPLANKLVFAKVRERLGLDRCRVAACSAAPISLDTLEFFLSLGIPILEVYGMSEVTGPGTFSLPDRYRTGKAGFAFPGAEVSIAEDGEILMRGPHVFLGYHKNEPATREALDEEGWIHSGDIGELDADGFLKVTDRKKELIITSGGKNIGPQNLENHLKQIPVVAQAVVIGDRRNYVAALLTLDPERLVAEAEAAGSPARDPGSAATCPIFRAHLERQVEAVNRQLASYETIKRFVILPSELTIEGGELTPTMKLKRRVINQKYAAEIEQLYS